MKGEITTEHEVASRAVREAERALARCWAKLYGYGPSRVCLGVREDDVLFSFDDGLSPADRLLLEKGCGDLVRGFREAFIVQVADQLAEVLTSELALAVTSVDPAFYPAIPRTDIYFRVGLDFGDKDDDETALRAWGAQTRRKARALGEESRRLGERTEVVRVRFEELRNPDS